VMITPKPTITPINVTISATSGTATAQGQRGSSRPASPEEAKPGPATPPSRITGGTSATGVPPPRPAPRPRTFTKPRRRSRG
jgi:hypothetical protein